MGLREKLVRKSVDLGLIPVGKKPGRAVLMYHGVVEPHTEQVNTRVVTTKEFDAHLIGFQRYFHVATVANLFDGNVPKDRFSIALSFDDGLKNNFDLALPLLEKHKTPATFFVTGANAADLKILWGDLVSYADARWKGNIELNGQGFERNVEGKFAMSETGELLGPYMKRLGDASTKAQLYGQLQGLVEELEADKSTHQNWKLMNDTEIQKAAASPLIEIGSHGFGHLELGSLADEMARDDLQQSKEYLSKTLGLNTNLLAHPSGSYNTETLSIAEKLGYTRQFAVDYRNNGDEKDPRILDRYGVFSFPCTPRFFNYLITQKPLS